MATVASWNFSTADDRISNELLQKLRAVLKETASVFAQEPWQPWKFRIEGHSVELFLGDEKTGEAMDHDGREGIIRCGLALQTLKTELKHQGCLDRVKLFPELDQPSLVARVYVCECDTRDEREQMLFDVTMPVSRSFQQTGDSLISDTTLNLIYHAAASERCWLEIAECQKSRERLLELAGVSEHWLFQMTGVRNRLPRSTSGSVDKSGGFNGGQKFSLGVKLRVQVPISGVSEKLDASAIPGIFAVLKTKTDDKHGWITAGQTAAQLDVTARKLGLSCTFFNHALRKQSVRQGLRTSIGHKGFGQVIVQFNAADHPINAAALFERTAIPASDYV